MTNETERKWCAGVDYVRLTSGSVKDFTRYADAYRAAYWDRHNRYAPYLGWNTEEWEWLGYKGCKSSKAGWGVGETGAIIQASSWLAQEVAMLDLPWCNVPRADYQITLWDGTSPVSRITQALQQSEAARVGLGGRAWKLRYVDGRGDGDTLYIGSRQSEVFVRVYDKEKESGNEPEYEGAVRYEVETKGEVAKTAFSSLQVYRFAPCKVASYVRGILDSRGVALPSWVQMEELQFAQPRKEESTVEQKLRWLRKQVGPTIEALRQAGEIKAALNALSITKSDLSD